MQEKMAEEIDDIDALLAGYSKPAVKVENIEEVKTEQQSIPTVANAPTPQVQPLVQPVQPAPTSNDPDAPYGRYLTGKKAGQPKKAPKTVNGQPYVAPQQIQPVQQPQITGSIIDAGLFLVIINMLIPMCIALGNNYFSDTKIDPKKLQLKDDQIKDLKQVTADTLKQINLTGHPLLILFIGLVSAFAVNFMAVKMDAEFKQKDKPKTT